MLRVLLYIFLVLAVIVAAGILLLQGATTWTPGEVVRTPESRFANLPDYPFEANYVEAGGYRVHYLDEGPRDGEVIYLLHGQPSWSFLYRKMIPPLTAAGYRVVVPDLVGFGKSDKPVNQADHSYQMHIDTMTDLVRKLDLRDATYFGQDWGGLVGLRVVAEEPDRFARIVLSNTGLPKAGGLRGWIGYPLFQIGVWMEGTPDSPAEEGEPFRFTRWVAWARNAETFEFKGLFQGSTVSELTDAELEAYAAPFPDETYQAGPRIFPFLVASQLRQNQQAWDEVFAKWDKPLLTAFSDSDPVTKGQDVVWQDGVPGAQGQSHTTIRNAGHFVQEDAGEELAAVILDFIDNNPL